MRGPFITSPILKILLGILASLGGIAFVLFVAVTEDVRMEAQTNNWDGRQIENGAALYANNCASCHGMDGKGGTGPALQSHYFFRERMADVGWNGSIEDYVALTVEAGRPSKVEGQWLVKMATWGESYGGPLRGDQVEAVAAYVANWEASALQQTAEEDPWIPFLDVDKPAEAQTIGELTEEELAAIEAAANETAEATGPRDPADLFQTMTCVACHNLNAPQTDTERGPVGPNFGNLVANAAERVDGLSVEEYIHQSIVAPNEYLVSGYASGLMPQGFADQMTEEEIQNMVTWLIEQSE